MTKHASWTAMLLVLAAVCAACQITSGAATVFPPTPTVSSTEGATQTASSLPPTPAPSTAPAQPAVIGQAKADLAGRLGVAPAVVEVVAVIRDEFPAQNLGCPTSFQKDSPVLPAFVTGLVIRLRVAGATYEYHAHGGQVIFCGPP